MSQETLRATIADYLTTGVAAALPSVQIRYENRKFLQPKATWIDFQIDHGAAGRASIGSTSRLNRKWGVISIGVYVVEDSGTAEMNSTADTIINLFDNRQFNLSDGDQVTCQVPRFVVQGKVDGYMYGTVIVPFYRDHRAS